jgi:hypothetical protein
LWLETWRAAASGADGPIKALPIAYLLLPAAANISPPPLVVVKVLTLIVNKIKTETSVKNNNSQDFPAVNVLEAVIDTFCLRLNSAVSIVQNVVQLLDATTILENSFRQTVPVLMPLYPDQFERLASVLGRYTEISNFKKKVEKQYESSSQIETIVESGRTPWTGWQKNVTLDWLMSGGWHHVDGLRAAYASSEEYAEALLKVWCLLTFYWGSGAVWPRCSHKQAARAGAAASQEVNACGEPLLVPCIAGTCRTRGCGKAAVWSCFRPGHDNICKLCLRRKQDELVGEPSVQASTDLYDAVIERELVRREEAVYVLRGVQSRKPPKIAPNWKSSI